MWILSSDVNGKEISVKYKQDSILTFLYSIF